MDIVHENLRAFLHVKVTGWGKIWSSWLLWSSWLKIKGEILVNTPLLCLYFLTYGQLYWRLKHNGTDPK
jgi:hypothetical protein